jgi:hypothetical protein
MKYSLCIPTLDRYDNFLSKNLPKYLENPLIDEIIIVSENANDYIKIIENFPNEIKNEKIKIYKNDCVLGPFLNKIETVKKAKNDWIALIDSDNYADKTYFKLVDNFINKNYKNNNSEMIVSPCFAKPTFDYRCLENNIITKKNLKYISKINLGVLLTLMNTGNYVLNKNLIINLNLNNEYENIAQSSSCDVIYMNTLFLEQYTNFQMYILKDLHYDHKVHNDSIYIKTFQNHYEFNDKITRRFKTFLE